MVVLRTLLSYAIVVAVLLLATEIVYKIVTGIQGRYYVAKDKRHNSDQIEEYVQDFGAPYRDQ